jgi:hypothetical protein
VTFGFSPLESGKVLILSISRCAGFFLPYYLQRPKRPNKQKERKGKGKEEV